MIEVKGVSKYYGDKLGISGLNFSVEKGEIVGLLGPNGAGKSTTMKMLTGYHMPTEGSIIVDGWDIVEETQKATRHIGFMPEVPPLYLEMEVEEYLLFSAAIRGINKKEIKESVEHVMELAGIEPMKKRLIRNLSKGYRQRTGLAQALLGMPEILILDEPTAGLDPRQITEVRELLKNLSKKHTIILSSHILSEISQICERVIILNQGHMVAADTMENLRNQGARNDRFMVTIAGTQEGAVNALAGVEGIRQLETLPGKPGKYSFAVIGGNSDALKEAVFWALGEHKIPILEMKDTHQSLEEIFLRLTGDSLPQEECRS